MTDDKQTSTLAALWCRKGTNRLYLKPRDNATFQNYVLSKGSSMSSVEGVRDSLRVSSAYSWALMPRELFIGSNTVCI